MRPVGKVPPSVPPVERPENGRIARLVTYTPVTGVAFTRSLLTPIQPVSLLGMIQSGWPAEFVFGIAVRSINGISNGTLAPLLQQDADPRFGTLLKALTAVQKSSAIDIRIDRRPEGEVAVLVLQQGGMDEVAEARRTVRQSLGLDVEAREFVLEYGSLPNSPNAVAMLTRSLLEIIGEFSFGIDVPEDHLAAGRALRVQQFTGGWVPPRIPIKAGSEKPTAEEAFVAVPYRGYWYWIEDTDFRAKRVFSFLLLLTSLAETGTAPSAPLITVGTGG